MRDLPGGAPHFRDVLGLARRDRAAATKALAELDVDTQVALVCSAPVSRRAELLDLSPSPDLVVPRLPEAELCFTVKAIGLESAADLLEYATPEQVTAALDLDAWNGPAPDAAALDAWVDALAETSDDALHRGLEAIDPELLVLYLKGRVLVVQKPDEAEGWDPPCGAHTLEGAFYLQPLRENDDLAGVLRVLRVLFERDYWTYFRALQGVIWELATENEEWALRWRTARLQDLGFPSWDEAMLLYRYLAPKERAAVPEQQGALDVSDWRMPVWMPSLPEGADSKHLVFRTLAGMEPEERTAAFYAVVAIANKVAVADRMALSDVETTPKAIEKAAHWISRGLEHQASQSGLDAREVLRRATLEHLFRVGANLDPDAARR